MSGCGGVGVGGLLFLRGGGVSVVRGIVIALYVVSVPFFRSFSGECSGAGLGVSVPSRGVRFEVRMCGNGGCFVLPGMTSRSLGGCVSGREV